MVDKTTSAGTTGGSGKDVIPQGNVATESLLVRSDDMDSPGEEQGVGSGDVVI